MKNRVSEMKNTLGGTDSRLALNLKTQQQKNIQDEAQGGKEKKKNKEEEKKEKQKQNTNDLKQYTKQSDIRVIGVQNSRGKNVIKKNLWRNNGQYFFKP